MIPPIRATATTQALWPSTGRKAKDSQIGSGTLHSPSEAIVSRDHCRGSTSRTEGRAKPPSSILRTQIARARIDANHPENWRNFIDLAARPRLHEVGKRAVSKREILEVSDAQGSGMSAQHATLPRVRPSRSVPTRAAQVRLSRTVPARAAQGPDQCYGLERDTRTEPDRRKRSTTLSPGLTSIDPKERQGSDLDSRT